MRDTPHDRHNDHDKPRPADTTPCPACAGEGYIEVIGGPGYFDENEECWMPSEDVEPCTSCRGTGVQDHDEPASSIDSELQPVSSYEGEAADTRLPF